MKSLRYFTYSMVVALLFSAGAVRAADESPYKFEFHGFMTGSLYTQNQVFMFGSGQGLLVAAPAPGNAAPCKTAACDAGVFAAGQATKSGNFFGGDARQSRVAFALSGPQVFAGATPKAYFEADAAGYSAGGVFSESWSIRMRQAYAELKWTNFVFQAGQHSAQLAFVQMPDSVSHIANPISFGAGNFGWRTMGARGMYTIPMDGAKLELALSVASPTWADNAPPGATPGAINAGMANGLPELEARVKLDGKAGDIGYTAYVDGLYQGVNLKGFGEIRPAGFTLADGVTQKTSATVQAIEVGGKVTFAPVYVAANFYTGKGLGSLAGALVQQGDIQDTEYWVSAGAYLTKEFSLSATFGQALLDEKDVRNWVGAGGPYANPAAAGGPIPKKDNTLIGAMAKYMDGGYAFALEYISYKTTYLQGTWAQYAAGTQPGNISTDGYQLIASAGYFF